MPVTQENMNKKRFDVLPDYSQGTYFTDPRRHSADALFKAKCFAQLFLPYVKRHHISIRSLIDVGCGSGDFVKEISKIFHGNGLHSVIFKGYDVSPHVQKLKNDGVEYVFGDFTSSDETVDVITLMDVIEHVSDPVGYIMKVSERCKMIVFHIPLEHSFYFASTDRFRASLMNPGHLFFVDITGALNLLSWSGLRVVDYAYTFGFKAPSGHNSTVSRILFPLRYLLSKINPWLLSRTLGGTGLIIISMTPSGTAFFQPSIE
jgi:SAM-dependent methyltransferase